MQGNTARVWCLLGRKAGDNTQVLALARALGWGYEEKHILAQPWELFVHLGSGATLAGIDRAASSTLQAPWPDLVLSAGRRNEPVAQWIRAQSGGHSALVHFGRPWAPLDAWDLIITTPQYFLPRQDNIVHNQLPLHDLAREQLRPEGEALRARLRDLPRPWIALLVGGDSGRFVLTADKGARLGRLADTLAQRSGGALLVADSPRTPRAASDALRAALDKAHFSYRWGDPGDNPYRGMLAQADAFVVTGESMSMLGEATAMGRPVFIFDPGDGDTPWWRLRHNYRYKPLSHRLAMAWGPARMRRDVGNIQSALVADGRARWLREDLLEGAALDLQHAAPSRAPVVADADLQRATHAVQALLREKLGQP
ncbi:mitochondrial fission ELM1 family protein [Mangrovimicrobium sediminis]|uniref:mitochondrial fission ELM1 family protein n=1 Tax=Mangrovimicrobium sediminis TaxID=2562682 RepID=UPI0014368494|nr:ELM1/GtrOC1 family putative glycosyltransferase [Haliea sp. SAOS-164]